MITRRLFLSLLPTLPISSEQPELTDCGSIEVKNLSRKFKYEIRGMQNGERPAHQRYRIVTRHAYGENGRLCASRTCWVDLQDGNNNNTGWNCKTAVADIETAFKKVNECENLERYI